MSSIDEIIKNDKNYLFQNYGDRLPVEFVKGNDVFLYDEEGKEYLDFLSGISVSNLGYNNPRIQTAMHAQLDSIIHTSNWFHNSNQISVAKLISESAFAGKTLFVNTGTEANEAAIKLARKYGLAKDPERYYIITFEKSFHGRTFGSMSATANPKINTGFGPIVPGFIHVPFNDIVAFNKAISEYKVCAVMTELVQGEGGINLIDKNFLNDVIASCKKHDIILIADEVQTALGRTGAMYVHQHFGIKPDILTLAKGLGNGIPCGALHAKDELAQYLPAGAHGTTFGGNHLAMRAAEEVLTILMEPGFLENVQKLSQTAFNALDEIRKSNPLIKDIRGVGLHIGVELDVESGFEYVKKGLDKGIVLNCTAGNVIRLMPPVTISEENLLKGIALFKETIGA